MADGYDRFENEGGSGSSFVMGLLTGTVLGAGLGMLFAPKSGSELRNQVAEQAGSLANTATEGYRRATETAGNWAEKGREVYDRARRRAVRARLRRRDPSGAVETARVEAPEPVLRPWGDRGTTRRRPERPGARSSGPCWSPAGTSAAGGRRGSTPAPPSNAQDATRPSSSPAQERSVRSMRSRTTPSTEPETSNAERCRAAPVPWSRPTRAPATIAHADMQRPFARPGRFGSRACSDTRTAIASSSSSGFRVAASRTAAARPRSTGEPSPPPGRRSPRCTGSRPKDSRTGRVATRRRTCSRSRGRSGSCALDRPDSPA